MTILSFKVTYFCGTDEDDTITQSGISIGETDNEAIDYIFDCFGDCAGIKSLDITPIHTDCPCFTFPNEVMENYEW